MNNPFNLLYSLDGFKKYKVEIETLFRHVKWLDLRSGEMILTEALINQEWRPIILEQLPESIDDLQMTLVDDLIRISLSGQMKGLTFNAYYDLAIDDFKFTANSHKLVLAIRHESVKAEQGLINKMLMSIINGFFIERIGEVMIYKAIEKLPEISYDNDLKKIVIDLERLPQYQKYLKIAVLDQQLIELVEMKLVGIIEKEIKLKIYFQCAWFNTPDFSRGSF